MEMFNGYGMLLAVLIGLTPICLYALYYMFVVKRKKYEERIAARVYNRLKGEGRVNDILEEGKDEIVQQYDTDIRERMAKFPEIKEQYSEKGSLTNRITEKNWASYLVALSEFYQFKNIKRPVEYPLISPFKYTKEAAEKDKQELGRTVEELLKRRDIAALSVLIDLKDSKLKSYVTDAINLRAIVQDMERRSQEAKRIKRP